MGTRVSPTLSVDLTLISILLSLSISPYLCLPPPVGSVHGAMEEFLWCITIEATQRGVNEMLGMGCLPHRTLHASDDVSTPAFDRALVIIIPSHILQSV